MIGKSKTAAQKTQIGQILVAAKIITNESLNEALQVTKSTHLPIGRVLTISGKLMERDLPALLEAQRLIRLGSVPMESMVNVLKNAYFCGTAFDEAINQQGWMVSEPDTDASDDRSNMNAELPKQTFLAEESSHEHYCNAVLELLKDATHVTADSINIAATHNEQISDMPQALCETGLIDDVLLDVARRCQNSIMHGFIGREHALRALACYSNEVCAQRPIFVKQVLGTASCNKIQSFQSGLAAAA